MRVLLFLSCVLTAKCYILSPLPYGAVRLLPAPVFRHIEVPGWRQHESGPETPGMSPGWKLQTPPPVPEPVVISLDDFDCPADGIFADEESGCEMYWVCNEEVRSTKKAFHYTCNPGQLFDASIGACNEASAVDNYCNIGAKTAPETSPIVLELPEDSVSFECPGEGAYADQESGCAKYFVCNGGRFWIYNCNPGLLFDAKIGHCNWPGQVDGYCNAEPDQRFRFNDVDTK